MSDNEVARRLVAIERRWRKLYVRLLEKNGHRWGHCRCPTSWTNRAKDCLCEDFSAFEAAQKRFLNDLLRGRHERKPLTVYRLMVAESVLSGIEQGNWPLLDMSSPVDETIHMYLRTPAMNRAAKRKWKRDEKKRREKRFV